MEMYQHTSSNLGRKDVCHLFIHPVKNVDLRFNTESGTFPEKWEAEIQYSSLVSVSINTYEFSQIEHEWKPRVMLNQRAEGG